MVCESKYEQMLTKEERKMAVQEMLSTNFPFKRMLITSILGTIISLILIIFQSIAIVYQAPLYYIGVGIWAGAYFLFVNMCAFALIIKRIVIVYTINKIVKLFAVLFLLSLVIVHLVSRFICTNGCAGSAYLWINYVIIVAGLLAKVVNMIGFVGLIRGARKQYKIFALNKMQQNGNGNAVGVVEMQKM